MKHTYELRGLACSFAAPGRNGGAVFADRAFQGVDQDIALHYAHGEKLGTIRVSGSQRGLEASGQFTLDDAVPLHEHLLRLINACMIRGLSLHYTANKVPATAGPRVITRDDLLGLEEVSICKYHEAVDVLGKIELLRRIP